MAALKEDPVTEEVSSLEAIMLWARSGGESVPAVAGVVLREVREERKRVRESLKK